MIFVLIFNIYSCSFLEKKKDIEEIKIIKNTDDVKGNTGYNITQRFTVMGFVYDKNKMLLSGVNISIKFLNNQDKKGDFATEFITDSDGAYYFKGIPENTDLEIIASKVGYKKITRIENINDKRYLKVIPEEMNINFGGEGNGNKYALENENIGSTGQLIGRYAINGIIYDNNNNIIPNANIKIKIISSRFLQDMSEKNITSDDNGRYVFRSILDNTEIELYISKIGYKSVLRNYIVDSNLYLISLKPVGNINFGGEGEDKKYALEKII